MVWVSMWRVWGRREKYSVLVGNMKKIHHLEDTGVGRRIILKWM
jgi:hypothetical protein